MKRIILVLLFCFVMPTLLLATEKPSEESLIKAWEELKKSDPNTITFEKIADHLYKYKTKLFPFDGELKINDATIENIEMGPYNGFIMGPLDVELVDLPKDVPQKYSRKYAIWLRSNTLYFDRKAGKWLTPQEFQNVITKMSTEMSKPSGLFSNYIALTVLLLALIYVIYFLQKNRQAVKTSLQRQTEAIARVEKSIELSEKGMQLSEETNKLLKEILEVLKGKG